MLCMLMHLTGHSGHAASAAHTGAAYAETPLDILRRRYALGEIGREQFEEMSRVLGTAADVVAGPAPEDHCAHA